MRWDVFLTGKQSDPSIVRNAKMLLESNFPAQWNIVRTALSSKTSAVSVQYRSTYPGFPPGQYRQILYKTSIWKISQAGLRFAGGLPRLFVFLTAEVPKPVAPGGPFRDPLMLGRNSIRTNFLNDA